LLAFPIQGLYGSLILPLAYPIDRIPRHEAEDAIIQMGYPSRLQAKMPTPAS
jgi:hypothetical protein